MQVPRPRFLGLVVANLVATAIHFTDNVVRFGEYPDPTWFTAPLVAGFWFVQSAVGIGGLTLHRQGNRAGRPLLAAYAALGFAGLGHYLVPWPHRMDWFMHATIALEAVAALALLLGVALWKQPGSAPSSTPSG